MEKDKAPIIEDSANRSSELATRPALKLDVERYQKMLDSTELSEDEKQDFLETVWSIVIGFVDLGFEINPLQQADPKGCEQETDLSSFLASNVVSSNKGHPKTQFAEAAYHSTDDSAERIKE